MEVYGELGTGDLLRRIWKELSTPKAEPEGSKVEGYRKSPTLKEGRVERWLSG